MAIATLVKRQEIAANWPIFADRFTVEIDHVDEQYMRCKACDLAVWVVFYMDDKGIRHVYKYQAEEILALTVAHIANHHPEVYDGLE